MEAAPLPQIGNTMDEPIDNGTGVRVAFKIEIYTTGKELPASYDSYMYFKKDAIHLLNGVEAMMDSIYDAYVDEMNRIEPRFLRIEHSNFTNSMILKEKIESITVHSPQVMPKEFEDDE